VDRLWKVALYAPAVGLLFATGLVLSHHYDVSVDIVPSMRALEGSFGYQPLYVLEPGEQLVMVYIGSSTCGWSNDPALPGAVEELKVRLSQDAVERGVSFKAVGVAVDASPDDGMEHLSRFGKFDELAAGYGWANSSAARYLGSSGAARLATPQIVVLTQVLVVPDGADTDVLDEHFFRETGQSLLAAVAGTDRILQWADSPLKLP
jgi:hypothetical protein